jgi:hypothetical protein
VLAFRRRAGRYGRTSRLGLCDLSEPDDPPSSKLPPSLKLRRTRRRTRRPRRRRDRQHGNVAAGKAAKVGSQVDPPTAMSTMTALHFKIH